MTGVTAGEKALSSFLARNLSQIIYKLQDSLTTQLRGFPMFNVQCGPMTNKEYQIFPAAASAPEVDIEIHFLHNFKGNNGKSISLFFNKCEEFISFFIMHF